MSWGAAIFTYMSEDTARIIMAVVAGVIFVTLFEAGIHWLIHRKESKHV